MSTFDDIEDFIMPDDEPEPDVSADQCDITPEQLRARNEIIDDMAALKARLEQEGFKPITIDKPYLDTSDPDLAGIVKAAWDAIAQNNKPERLFRYGALTCRIVFNEGVPALDVLDQYKLQLESATATNWIIRKKSGAELPARPPLNIVRPMLAAENIPLPVLSRIVTAPVFSENGKLIDKPGYNQDGRIFYYPGNFNIDPIPDTPSVDEVQHSIDFIKQLFQDFPFVSDADRAAAWAALFVIPCRDMIRGPVPATIYESPEAGTGKGLLCECSLYLFTAGNWEKFTPTQSEDEERKRYTAGLENGKPAFILDNYNDLSGAQTAVILTSDTWSDRRLGEGRIITMPIRQQICATGNNITLSTEIARRVIRCRIEAKVDRPWLRTGFKIENLMEWTQVNRAELVRSILMIIQSWIAAGKPKWTGRALGSYFEWSYIVGGILQHIGVKGFLDNILEIYEQSDMEGRAIRDFISAWWLKYKSEEQKAVDLFQIAKVIESLPIAGKDEDSRRRSFSRFMTKQRSRIFRISIPDGKQDNGGKPTFKEIDLQVIDAGQSKRAALWKLQNLDDKLEVPAQDLFPGGA